MCICERTDDERCEEYITDLIGECVMKLYIAITIAGDYFTVNVNDKE